MQVVWENSHQSPRISGVAKGALGEIAPRKTGQRQNYCWISVVHSAELNWKWFFYLREASSGLEYAQNAFAAGASPDPTGGDYDAPQDPLVGWGGDTPPRPHPIRWLRRIGSAPSRTHNFWLRHCHGWVIAVQNQFKFIKEKWVCHRRVCKMCNENYTCWPPVSDWAQATPPLTLPG